MSEPTNRPPLPDLESEVAHLKERLQGVRAVVQILRDKLARERAARAVLTARLLDLKAEETAQMQAAAAAYSQAAKAEENQARELDGLKALVRVLGQSTMVSDLRPDAAADVFPHEWHWMLEGKRVGEAILQPDGSVVIPQGALIDPGVIEAAMRAGRLFELILSMQVPMAPPPEL